MGAGGSWWELVGAGGSRVGVGWEQGDTMSILIKTLLLKTLLIKFINTTLHIFYYLLL